MPEIENNQNVIKQEKWKSPVFWGTIATSIVGVLSLLGFWSWVGVQEDLVLRIIGALVALASQIIGGWNTAENKNSW